jgi:hypothetical protein
VGFSLQTLHPPYPHGIVARRAPGRLFRVTSPQSGPRPRSRPMAASQPGRSCATRGVFKSDHLTRLEWLAPVEWLFERGGEGFHNRLPSARRFATQCGWMRVVGFCRGRRQPDESANQGWRAKTAQSPKMPPHGFWFAKTEFGSGDSNWDRAHTLPISGQAWESSPKFGKHENPGRR